MWNTQNNNNLHEWHLVRGSSHRMHTNNNNDDVFLLLVVLFAIQSFLHIPLPASFASITSMDNDNNKMCVEYESQIS